MRIRNLARELTLTVINRNMTDLGLAVGSRPPELATAPQVGDFLVQLATTREPPSSSR